MPRAVLISPERRTLEYLDHSGDYEDIRAVCGCETLTAVQLSETNTMYLDDEGLLRDPPGPFFVICGDKEHVFAGPALILGVDSEGDSCNVTIPTEWLQLAVRFPKVELLSLETSEETLNHPVFGEVTAITQTPRFEITW